MPANQNNISPVKLIVFWLPVIGFSTLVFYVSSIPGDNIPEFFPNQGILFHIVEYALLAMLLTRALKKCFPTAGFVRIFFWVFFLSFSFALTDEFHQVFIPGRFPALSDVASDSVGIFVGKTVYRWLK